MRLPPTSFGLTHVDIVDLSAYLALVLIVDLHDLDFLLAIAGYFLLVVSHEVRSDAQLPDFLWGFHLDDHVVEDEEGLVFDGLEGLEDVAVLLAVEVERILGRILLLELINWVGRTSTNVRGDDLHTEPPVFGNFCEEVLVEGLVEAMVLFHQVGLL